MKRALLYGVSRIPLLGRLIVMAYRVTVALPTALRPLGHTFTWLFTSRETTNHTFDLTPLNRHTLTAQIADVVGQPHETIQAYIDELEADEALRNHIIGMTRQAPYRGISDLTVRYSRRLGWYAMVRATKPSVVIETGVDKGLGACVLTAALLRNREEGHPGRYYGTDINPQAGYLLRGRYAEVGEILYGDSIQSLKALEGPIDLFINDSDHSAEYEGREYATIEPKLSPQAIVLGDNSHITDELLNFAIRTGRSFQFFKEETAHHWYPGAGIGFAFRRGDMPRK